MITAVYSGVSLDSHSSVQDITGFLVILGTEILFIFVYAVFYLIYEVLPLLRKETGDRLYTLSAYYVSLVFLMVRGFIFRFPLRLFLSFLDSTSVLRDISLYRNHLFLNWHRPRFWNISELFTVNNIERNLRNGLWILLIRIIWIFFDWIGTVSRRRLGVVIGVWDIH